MNLALENEIRSRLRHYARLICLIRSIAFTTGPVIAASAGVVVLQIALRLNIYNTLLSLVICVLSASVAVCFVIALKIKTNRRLPSYLQLRFSLLLFVVICIYAALACIYGTWPGINNMYYLLLIPLCAIIGFALRLARGLSVKNAAAIIDDYFDLSERLSASADIMHRNVRDHVGRFIYRNALNATRNIRLRDCDILRPNTAVAGIISLMIILSLTVSILPVPSAEKDILNRLDEMSRRDLVSAGNIFSKAALQKQEFSQNLKTAAELSRAGDRKELAEILAGLERAGLDVKKYLRPIESTETGLAANSKDSNDSTDSDLAIKATPALHDEEYSGSGKDYTSVYNPNIGKRIDKPEMIELYPDGNIQQQSTRDIAAQWTRASKHAEDMLRKGQIPPEYKLIIRRYFSPE